MCKCIEAGIHLLEVEESYTSGTSFLDNELPTKENYNKTRREYRGLFVTNTNQLKSMYLRMVPMVWNPLSIGHLPVQYIC